MKRTIAILYVLFNLSVFLLVGSLLQLFIATFGLAPSGPLTINLVPLWVVSEDGRLISQNSDQPLPKQWEEVVASTKTAAKITLLQEGELSGVGAMPLTNGKGYVIFKLPKPLSKLLPLSVQYQMYFKWVISFMVPSVLLLAAFFFAWVRKKSRIAEKVIQDLKNGHLKSRFPASGIDEVGSLMSHFNEMADQIEQLVTRLRQAENARTSLLKELAHDVRTPLTSLRYLIEQVGDIPEKLSPSEISARMNTAGQELLYFEKLIEELFLISQLDTPDHEPRKEQVGLIQLLKGEIEQLNKIQSSKIVFLNPLEIEVNFRADSFLVKRLWRNVIENACRFAKSSVEVEVTIDDKRGVQIIVMDDGPGFSEAGLTLYGKRRASRFVDGVKDFRISLGLGSVIATKIAHTYGCSLEPSNRLPSANRNSGARVTLSLPVSSEIQVIYGRTLQKTA